jgi:hypothetical protein
LSLDARAYLQAVLAELDSQVRPATGWDDFVHWAEVVRTNVDLVMHEDDWKRGVVRIDGLQVQVTPKNRVGLTKLLFLLATPATPDSGPKMSLAWKSRICGRLWRSPWPGSTSGRIRIGD